VTMMDAALKYAEANIPVMPLHWIVRMAPAPARQGEIATARESIRYIPAGTIIPLLMLSNKEMVDENTQCQYRHSYRCEIRLAGA